jgi:hypothetical protein
LLEVFIKQIKADTEITRDKGTRFKLSF